MERTYDITLKLYDILKEHINHIVDLSNYESDVDNLFDSIKNSDVVKINCKADIEATIEFEAKVNKYIKNAKYFQNQKWIIPNESIEILNVLEQCISDQGSAECIRLYNLICSIIEIEEKYPQCKLLRYRSVNCIVEFNRKYQAASAVSDDAKELFSKMPYLCDNRKQILYENISTPIFTKELEYEISSILKVLNRCKPNNEYENYILKFIHKLLLELQVNNHIVRVQK